MKLFFKYTCQNQNQVIFSMKPKEDKFEDDNQITLIVLIWLIAFLYKLSNQVKLLY